MNDNLLEFKRNPFVAPQEIEASFLFFNEVLRLGMQFCTTPPLFNRVSLDARGVRLGTGLVVSHTRVHAKYDHVILSNLLWLSGDHFLAAKIGLVGPLQHCTFSATSYSTLMHTSSSKYSGKA